MPPPGWYPDPEGRAGQRWWDGTQWTDHTGGPPAAGQGGGAPPGWSGAPSGYGAGPPARQIDPWLWQSIVATLLCCLPAGIVGIVFAAQAQTALGTGDVAQAERKASLARTWTIVSIALGLAWIPFLFFVVLGGAAL